MAEPYYADDAVTLYLGDCLDVLRELPDCSVDSVVTDPPYNLSFMAKTWDTYGHEFQAWCQEWAAECLRVLKPGGHILAFGGSRTWHRLAAAVEDAGFEIRDSIAWLYGSGFPKSLDVSKAIDKARDDGAEVLAVTTRLAELAEAAGITRGDVDTHMGTSDMGGWWLSRLPRRAACPSVENWSRLRALIPGAHELNDEVWRLNGRKGSPGEAWQTAEVIGVDRRMNEASGVVNIGQGERSEVERQLKAANSDAARQWQGWGTALKPAFEPIVVGRKPLAGTVAANVLAHGTGALNIDGCRVAASGRPLSTFGDGLNGSRHAGTTDQGRWPTNVALDDSQAAGLDAQSGVSESRVGTYGAFAGDDPDRMGHGDSGGASRFFPTFRYEAKAPASERPKVDGTAHPTVKPLDLMRWLVRLVTPPGGTVLEPFAGSGTTVEACLLEGFKVVAIEREVDYLPLIQQRINRRRNPAAYVELAGEDQGLFALIDEEGGAA